MGQYGSSSEGLAVTATERISVKPDKLRLVMWVKGQGKDTKSAIASLTEQKAKVKKELEAMKATADSIVFTAPRVGPDNQQENGARMVMRMQGRPGAKPVAPPVVFAARVMVKAEWDLPVKEGDALAILPANLLEQIKNRDLEGTKAKASLDDDEQEQMDEIDALMQEQYYSQEPSSGRPRIEFVTTVTEDEIQKAYEKAFAKATEDAKSLAKAGNVKIGKLRGASKSPRSEYTIPQPYYSRGYGEEFPTSFIKDSPNVVSASNPDELSLTVGIDLVYEIE